MSTDYKGLETEKKRKLIKGLPSTDYYREYRRDWARKKKDFDIKPSQTAKMKAYYEEYKTMKQQEVERIVEFKEFMLQFFEIGYLAWRTKVKGK